MSVELELRNRNHSSNSFFQPQLLVQVCAGKTGCIVVTMAGRRTPKQKNLARYMAYRVAAWKVMNPGAKEATLAKLLGLYKGDVTHLRDGTTSSDKKAMLMSKVLGPRPLEVFQDLSEKWAAAFPDWAPNMPAPDPPPFVVLDSDGWWSEVAALYPPKLLKAGRIVVAMLDDEIAESGDVIQRAVELTWKDNREQAGSADYSTEKWVEEVKRYVRRVQQGSGVRRSSGKIKSAPEAE